MKLPIIFLRAEGAIILFVGLVAYLYLGYNPVWFITLFFSFDISILGYVINPRVGAITYNSIHSFIGSSILLLLGFVSKNPLCISYGLIWFAHLGFDRMIGFGFMKSTGFGDSNLGKKLLPDFIRKLLAR